MIATGHCYIAGGFMRNNWCNLLSHWDIKRFYWPLLVDLDRVVPPNAILGRHLYPFYFQETVTGKALASAILDAVEDQSAKERLMGAASELKSLLTGDRAAFSDLVLIALQNWLGPPKKPA